MPALFRGHFCKKENEHASFFCEAVTGDRAVITGEDARHIAKVLRMRLGEGLTLSAADGMDYDCVIEGLSPELVELCIQRAYPNETEPRAKVTLFQCVPKSDKMDWIVQKAVELGVFEVVPVLSKRCVSRPDAKTAAKKVERWQKNCQGSGQAERQGHHSRGASDDHVCGSAQRGGSHGTCAFLL